MSKRPRRRNRISSYRLKGYDYGSNSMYSVTINTKNKVNFFGEVIEEKLPNGKLIAKLQETEIGRVANEYWQSIPEHFPFVQLDEFVVMPNHIHGVLFFYKPDYDKRQPNKFGPQSQNLGSVIRGFKAGVKAYATTNNITFQWHPRYYDSVVRSMDHLNNLRVYIRNNPRKWLDDGKHLRPGGL